MDPDQSQNLINCSLSEDLPTPPKYFMNIHPQLSE